MATAKTKFRASSIETREGTLYHQVIHGRIARQINTGYKLYPNEWDPACSEIILPPGADEKRQAYLRSLQSLLLKEQERLDEIIRHLEQSGSIYSADRVVTIYRSQTSCGHFIAFAKQLVEELKQVGKERTAETYTSALNSFVRFRRQRDIPMEDVNSSLIVEYEAYLKSEGVCLNSISYYMRNLRAIYNRAVEQELVTQRNPFKYVYTGIDKTVKRAIPLKVIRQIRDLDLAFDPTIEYARDLFMFSFYTRGMSFINMAYLKKKDLQNGILSYRRQKTGQQLFIKWERPMQEIVDKYDMPKSQYLLPIIRDAQSDKRKQYKSATHLVNAKLKRVGRLLRLNIPLTTYVARHAWASIAKSKNIPISTISEAMGHDSESTTRIYLASLDTSVVDKANSLILNSL